MYMYACIPHVPMYAPLQVWSPMTYDLKDLYDICTCGSPALLSLLLESHHGDFNEVL